MGELTLVPETLAKVGHTFTYVGANDGEECQGCPVKNICFRLKPGHRYVIEDTRDVTHPCGLHEGRVGVCKVAETPLRTAIESRSLRGTAVHWKPVACGYLECPRYAACHPAGAVPDIKYEVMEAGAKVDCPMRHDITDVVLRPLE